MLGSSERIAALERHIAALEARPTMRYRGVWSAEQPYNEGEFCTDHGSIFYCRTATRARPGTSANWQLAVKRGSDAR